MMSKIKYDFDITINKYFGKTARLYFDQKPTFDQLLDDLADLLVANGLSILPKHMYEVCDPENLLIDCLQFDGEGLHDYQEGLLDWLEEK